MAAFNGVRVLPDIPKNIPNMETLIQEFEAGFRSPSCQKNVSESSASNGGNFVKKIVEAYESSVRATIENIEQINVGKRSGLFNTLRSRKNARRSDLSPTLYDELNSSLRDWPSIKNTSEISSVSSVVKKHDLEDDFATPNRCLSKNDKKTDNSKTWSGISSKINKCGFMKELTNIRFDSSKKSETETLKRRGQVLYSSPESERNSKNNIPLICSSPLEDVDGKVMDYNGNPINDILTKSHDSNNSNNSYKNLQVDLYNFEKEEWECESSLSSSRSLNSSSRSLYDDASSTKSRANDSLLLNTSLQDITVIPSNDVLNDYENLQEQILESSSSDRKSPRVIGVSLKRPIKIDNDTSVTWIPVLDEKLPRKKSLKKLLSVFNRARLSLNHRKKSKEKQPKRQYIFDSGFIERCPSVSSSSSQQSWHSDIGHVDDEPSTLSPTFGTFGRSKRVGEDRTARTVNNRVTSTEILDVPKLATDLASSDPNFWTSSNSTTSVGKENHQLVEHSLRDTSDANFSRSQIFCKYPLLPKHPHLIRSNIAKHPFVARTKMDQIEEEEVTAQIMQHGKKIEQKSNAFESNTLPISIPALNTFYPRMSECTDDNYDLPNSHTSTSALDEIVLRRQASAYDIPRRSWLSNLTMDSSPTIYSDNLYEEIRPCMPRFATVSPKNFRFIISQEKSRAMEKNFDS